MNYQVWLYARHPKTLETVATVRVYAHEDRLRAEHVLENAQADHQPLVLELLRVHPGALVNAEMRQGKSRETVLEEALQAIVYGTLLWGGPNRDDDGMRDRGCHFAPDNADLQRWIGIADEALK